MGTTSEYLRELYRLSRESVRKDFGTKGAFVILALKVSLTAIAIGLFVGLRLLPQSEPVYKVVYTIFASDIIGLIALWVITPLVAIFRMPQVASSKDSKQKRKIAKLEKIINQEAVKITKIKILSKHDTAELTSNSEIYSWLEIENNEKHDLRDCTIRIDILEFIWREYKSENWKERVVKGSDNLTWHNTKKEEEKIIRRNGGSARINIAKFDCQQKNLNFTLDDGDRQASLSEFGY